MPTGFSSSLSRRYDFDWLRIGALGLLILTHTTYVFRIDPWRVQSEHAGAWADLLIYMMAPWRICLVFFIAGAATRFMLERHDLKSFVQNRAMRLFVPFVMALIFLVPVMQYMSEPQLRGSNYADFLLGPGLHTRHILGIWLPDLGHVWFLIYVLLYAGIAALVWRFGRKAFDSAERAFNAAPVWLVLALLSACFVISDAILAPHFPRSNMLIDDPAGHVRAIAPFLLGLMLARPSQFWTRLARARTWILPLALAIFVMAIPLALHLTTVSIPSLGLLQTIGIASAIYGAVMLFLILALANRMLAKPGPGLNYFGDAIMPMYLMHQPVIVFVAEALHYTNVPLWAEFGLILGLAAGFPLFIYHFIVRPTPVLRVMFGLKASISPREKKPTPRTALAGH